MALNDIQQYLSEHNITTIEAGFADFHGTLRGKRFPVHQLSELAHSGFALCRAVLAWDLQCGIFPIELASFENGYPDLIAKPILDTLREIPWRPGSAFVLCDLEDTEGKPVEISPRRVLQNVIARATQLGYRPVIGAELEFYLLNEERKPVFPGVQAYSLSLGAEVEFVVGEIRNHLESFGIPVEASNTEYGPAQLEINLKYGDALTVADNTILFKNAVKEIARKHSLYASFMPKPWADQSGNGLHLHQSLWNLERTVNLFAEDSSLAQHYLAGLLDTLREFTALGAPSVNSFKRISEHSFAPTNVTWGKDNRTVAVRSLLSNNAGSRLELRSGSADANPYLAIAASIASGLNGIQTKLQSPPAHTGDGYLDIEHPLPKTLSQALDLLETSSKARDLLGEALVTHLLAIGRHEVELFENAVTDWERDRYLITP